MTNTTDNRLVVQEKTRTEAAARNILVASHPRSGTHLCINSFCLNVQDCRFSMIRNQYLSIERLILDHDTAYTDAWEAYVFGHHAPRVRLFKTHMTPAEIHLALEKPGLLTGREREIFQHIVETSKHVYVHRDGRDALVSWFHYMKDFGGNLPADVPARIQACSFSEFIHMRNWFFTPVRGFEDIDMNRVRYWSHHVENWLDEPHTIPVSYEGLSKDFVPTFSKLAASTGVSELLLDSLCKPPLIPAPSGGHAQRIMTAVRKRFLVQFYRMRDQHLRGVKHKVPLSAHARKGRVGDWQNYFSADDLHFFMEHAGAMLRKLGYDT